MLTLLHLEVVIPCFKGQTEAQRHEERGQVKN